jgi:SAM-dependent methyltransferase
VENSNKIKGPLVAPVPNDDLIRYTCGHGDAAEYVRSGGEVATQLELASRRFFGVSIADFKSVLDFGCGSGRVLGSLDFGRAEVSACDIGEGVAAFARAAFPRVRVFHSGLKPPLPFEPGEFDLIYSFSVFSHLDQDIEAIWLEELARVGKPGAAYLLTVHGDWFIEATLPPAEQAAVTKEGFISKKVHSRNGDALDFPEYYESTYHTSKYIYDNWSNRFEIVSIIKGNDPHRYLFDALAFRSEGGDVEDFRPMGQDLVVARHL